jgi:Bacterial Ig domain/RTX calcium-binding nonapeptide repeat (4 copies)/Cadherin domain
MRMRPSSSWFRALLIALVAAGLVSTRAVLAKPSEPARPAHAAIARAPLPACTIIGTQGNDTLIGTPGNDVICARGGDDVVRGGGGNDIIFGGPGNDTLDGGADDDRLYGFGGADRLYGGAGDDFLQGGAGPDVLSGGSGTDLADYSTRHVALRVTIGHGANDGRQGERDDVRGDVEQVIAGSGDDVLIGNGRANRLVGGAGRDVLEGGGADDSLLGGAGTDRLDGRDGARFVDSLNCGAGGGDVALADAADRVAANCEKVHQKRRRNHPPTDIRLSNASVAENQPIATTVGTLSAVDRDRRDRHRFALVAGAGSADNGSFRIAGATLQTNAVFDFEKKSSYSVRIRVTDRRGASFAKSFAIAVIDLPERVNHAPTDISLAGTSVDENRPAGTTVGTLSATDPDAGDTHTFTLVAGVPDNAAFRIVGSTLQTNQVLDFESKASYTIRVQVTDSGGAAFAKAFTITVNDRNDPPTADAKTVSHVGEDGSQSITLSGHDQEGAAVTFHVAAPAHGALDTTAPPATCDGATPSTCTASVLYTPAPDFNGHDSFSYTVNDGVSDSSAAAVSITVDPVNDAPDAINGDATTDEDGHTTVDLGALVSDKETSDANLTYEIVTPPAHGQLTGTGTPTYTPDHNFNGSDGFTYRVTDRGDPDGCTSAPCDAPKTSVTRTVAITVNPVNDVPQASHGSLATDEDVPATVDLGPLVSDVETSDANLTYEIVTAPVHGQLTGGGSTPTYTPNADFNGSDSFTYRVTDRGDPDGCTSAPCDAPQSSAIQTVDITINAVNDAPVNTLPVGPVTAIRDTDTPITGLLISDVDSGSDQVQVVLSVAHGTLAVSTSVPFGVDATEVPLNNASSVTVTAPLAAIDTTLADAHGLVYHSDAAFTGSDTLTVATNDLGHNGAGGAKSDSDTLAIDVVPPNTPPVAAGQGVPANEDTAKAITLSGSDADGDDPLSFAIASPPAHGSLGSLGAVSCDHATPNTCTADVTYTPDADYNGPDSFTFTVNDGRATSAAATVSITVTAVNDAPQLQNTEAGALPYTENDPATQITATTTVSDVDSANFDTGSLTVDFSAGGTVDDRLEIANQGTGAGQIGVSGSNVTFAGTTIGTFAGGTGTTPLVITLNANADQTATQALVRAITYRNVSDSPSTAARTVRFVLTDGDGGVSTAATRAIALTAVNDAPTLAGIESSPVGYVESVDSAPSQSQITNALTVADADNANLQSATVQITTGCRAAEDALIFANQNGISGSYTAATCVLTLTGATSLANYQTALRSIKYEDTSDTPDTTTRTVTFQVDDGQAANHASNLQSRDVTVTAANDSPTGVADTFNGTNSALAGVTLAVGTSPSSPNVSVSGTVLSNDTDPDSPNSDLTASAGSSSAHGGAVALNPDGTFTYTPAPGFTGSDTFTYTVHDNGSPDRTSTATVTVNVAGPRVWFVNPGGSAGNGTSASPLNSLAPLSSGGGSDSLDGTGDVIFVYQGTGNATNGGFVLEANQSLVGQPQGLSVTNANGTYNLVAAGGANPTITNSGGAGLTLADANTIQRVDVTGASGVGVTGSAINTLTYGANSAISGNSGGGLSLTGAAGGAISIGADISTSAGHSVSVANRTSGTTTLSGAINDTGTGISLTSNTGATVSFTGTLNASTAASDAFTATGGGSINVNTGATRALTTTTGTALTLNGVGGAIDLTDLDKNGAGTGISLTAASASVTIASGAAIANTTTAGVTIDQGTGAFTYAGTISNASGRAIQVTNRNTGSPGLVQFTGSVTSTGGTGVNLDNNDNGTLAFSGGLVLSTGANTAFSATNGGTVNVDNTGVVNTLTTTTGTALNVANTTIGATGLRFQSITAGTGTSAGSGPANGIVLNNTGSTGGLTVTGDGTNTSVGGNASGGTISNATGADGATAGSGVYLNNTSSVVLRRMTINGTNQNYGIRAFAVTNFTMEYSTVGGTNGTTVSIDNYGEGSAYFGNATNNGITGTGTFTNDNISGGRGRNLSIVNGGSASTLTLSVKGSTFGAIQNFGDGGDDFDVEARTSGSTMNVTFGGTNAGEPNTLTNAVGNSTSFAAQAGTTMDVQFKNNAISNNNPNNIIGGSSVILQAAGAMTYVVSGNTMRDANGSAIALGKQSSGTLLSGQVTNNTIGVAATTDSGSKTGNGIFVSASGGGTVSTTIKNNQIHQIHGNSHIYADNTGGSYTANFTIQGNTLDTPGAGWFAGIAITNGAPSSSDTVNVCADVGGTAAEQNALNFAGNLGIIVGSSGAASGHTFNLPGYAGGASQTNIQNFLQANNTGSFTTSAYADSPATFAAFTGTGTSCPTP